MISKRSAQWNVGLFVGLLYFASLWLGFAVRVIGKLPPIVWFANGVGIAILVLCGVRFWPWIFAAEFAFRLMRDAPQAQLPILSCFISAAGITFGQWLGVKLFLKRSSSPVALTHVRDVILFIVLVLGVGLGIGNAIQIFALWLADIKPLYSTEFAFKAWWIDGNIGVLVVGAGAIILWNDTRHHFRYLKALDVQLILALLGTFAVGLMNYTPLAVHNNSAIFRDYLLFPFLIWACLRWDVLGALLSLTVAATCATAGVLSSYVPRSMFDRMEDQILVHEFFIMILGATGFLFAAAVREKQEANRAKDQFLANMSHELRTPLGVVLGFSEVLGDENLRPDEKQQTLQIVRRNGERLKRIIDDILDLSRVETRRMVIENSDFSLQVLLDDVHQEFSIRAKDKNVDFRMVGQYDSAMKIYSDSVRIRQVLDNLLGNAIKFTSQGHVEFRVGVDESKVKFLIKDSGIGLSRDQQRYLFTAFSQVDGSHTRRFGGTGLGLALSKRIALLLGGDVVLEDSKQGQGSEFSFSFLITNHL